ncbi:bifunctional glutamate N-acetyltransferase/amino-acid acetyltransferase ArgJ [Ligilactobacillus sp. WILCCON 0076]|uniref:Arginine biosynthesis bifunctional protein ArgJ n=1 Tax=Ligilactobacillus ubinensis TaxID=2876789 RepID=A0A9X2FJD3_9LACO|nr:bifunctional glutamate N-acetyltransferase/amino-acid acetyltransferase ArgJ [Ligilactobacillus ubinensis]MCP0886864.1 bifunctional glutamate N-acetyltransferase/amino-acid acetyltransferase ArgJ [Ligilactobacillus ubinensis]
MGKTAEIEFTWPKGFYSDGLHSGLRKKRLDLGWFFSEVPASAAGVYTTNKFCAAPTALTKKTIALKQQLQGIVVNSAIANSCTGAQGQQDALTEQLLMAKKLEVKPELIGVASTGVIGETLPMEKIKNGINKLQKTQNAKITEAILTTDTHPKTISIQFEQAGKLCTMSGFCKGSGMIHPKMATMLGFVVTDAKVSGSMLQEMLSNEVETTFNQITVDGDTSTNDMVVTLANGQALGQQIPELIKDTEDYQVFKEVYHQVLSQLAQEIARDGEGATKLVEANVLGAKTKVDAQQVAKAIVGSSLVKTAVFGGDANWGRIIAAIGITAADINVDTVDIYFDDIPVVTQSLGTAFSEEKVAEALSKDKVTITVDLHNGDKKGQAWGCDLTYKYVQINASYRS